MCEGRGRFETPEPFSVASQAQRFDLEFVYPGAENHEGRMATRPVSLTRLELIEYRASLEALLARVHASEASGDWPAVASDAACSECPAAQLCPIPAELRDHRGTINSVAEAAEACEVLDREKAEHRARQTELRNFAKANGGEIRFGRKVWELVYTEHEVVTDKDELLAAVDRAVRYGEDFERADFIRVKGRTDFKARDLSEEELEQRTVESTYVLQLLREGAEPEDMWEDIATVTVPVRTKRKSIITAALKKAGLEPEKPIKVRVLNADSAHVSEVQAESEPRLRIS